MTETATVEDQSIPNSTTQSLSEMKWTEGPDPLSPTDQPSEDPVDSQTVSPEPDLSAQLFQKTQQEVNVVDPQENAIQQLGEVKTIEDSYDFIDTYVYNGGKLEELDQQLNLSEAAKMAVHHELELQQSLETNRAILSNPGATSEQLQSILQEVIHSRPGAEGRLFSVLEQDLSVNQKTRLQTEIQNIKDGDKNHRMDEWQQLKADLTPAEQSDLANFPKLLDMLEISEEKKQELAEMTKSSVDLSQINSTPIDRTNIEPAISELMNSAETPQLSGIDYFFIAYKFLIEDPRKFDREIDRLATEFIDRLLKKAGVDPELIEKLKNLNYNSHRELLRQSPPRLLRQIKRMDRYELREFLEDLDKKTRIQLVTGEHHDHKFTPVERQELFYDDKRLTKKDCEYLGIPSEVTS